MARQQEQVQKHFLVHLVFHRYSADLERKNKGCCELDPVFLSIEICQLTGQLDQVQKHLLKHLPFHYHFSYYVILCC